MLSITILMKDHIRMWPRNLGGLKPGLIGFMLTFWMAFALMRGGENEDWEEAGPSDSGKDEEDRIVISFDRDQADMKRGTIFPNV